MKIFIMRPKIVSIVTAGCSPVDQQQYAGCGSSRERPGRTESGGCRWDGTVRSSRSSSSRRRVLQSSAVQCQLINIDRHGHTTDRRHPTMHACSHGTSPHRAAALHSMYCRQTNLHNIRLISLPENYQYNNCLFRVAAYKLD